MLVPLLMALVCSASPSPLSRDENDERLRVCGAKPTWSTAQRSIYGGAVSTYRDAPWSVMMLFNGRLCSGSWISPRHILTASHCALRNAVHASATVATCQDGDAIYENGVRGVEIWNSDWSRVNVKPAKLFVFGACHGFDYQRDDMMIMELEHNVHFYEGAWPVCVANDTTFTPPGTRTHLYSYGHNALAVDTPNTSDDVTLRYGWFDVLAELGTFIQSRNLNGVAARPGDSGGGHMVHRNGRIYAVAVVSHDWDGGYYAATVGYYHSRICSLTGIC